MSLTIVIPAAGAAARMRGGDKLLELVDGEAMLRRIARLARMACPDVIVTLRDGDNARQNALAGLDVSLLAVADAAEGMAASIRAGAARAMGAVMILPADMPELEASDLAHLISLADQHPTAILRGTAADGTPGHPVVFPGDLRSELLGLTGDEGARWVLARNRDRVCLIALPDQRATTDLDTPEAWAAWRALRR